MNSGAELYNKAKQLIPGGTQLLSKRPELFLPDNWPAYYSKAKGGEIWDLDGNKYQDFVTMGIGASVLGYANDHVDEKVIDALRSGNMTSLNVPEEVELAELLLDIHPWAEMVRYSRSGGEAMTVAVRIGRAASGKDKVMFCGYHGWHDWYLAANLNEDKALDGHLLPGLEPKGVPRALTGTAIPFKFNDIEDFNTVLDAHGDETGVIVLEIVRNDEPDLEFLRRISEAAKSRGIVFIVDEITSGWRLNAGGAHLLYDVNPDIAVFGKTTSNGYPFGAIIGKKEVMQAAQTTFISSTYWTDRIGPTAALASIREMQKLNLSDHLQRIGALAQKGWANMLNEFDIPHTIFGITPLSHFGIQHEAGQVLKTYFTQEMLKQGYLASNVLYISAAHTEETLDKYLEKCREVFKAISQIIQDNTYDQILDGPVSHSGFKRLN